MPDLGVIGAARRLLRRREEASADGLLAQPAERSFHRGDEAAARNPLLVDRARPRAAPADPAVLATALAAFLAAVLGGAAAFGVVFGGGAVLVGATVAAAVAFYVLVGHVVIAVVALAVSIEEPRKRTTVLMAQREMN